MNDKNFLFNIDLTKKDLKITLSKYEISILLYYVQELFDNQLEQMDFCERDLLEYSVQENKDLNQLNEKAGKYKEAVNDKEAIKKLFEALRILKNE